MVIAVAGMAGQRRALDALAAGSAGDRGGVQQPPLVTPRRAGDRHRPQDGGDQRCGPAQAPVVGSLAAHVGEQVPQAAGDRAQPTTLGVVAQQDLGDRQADQLSVRQPWWPARSMAGFQQLVDGDVQCDDEVVEVGAHAASTEVDVAVATPTLGDLALFVTCCRPPPDSTSLI